MPSAFGPARVLERKRIQDTEPYIVLVVQLETVVEERQSELLGHTGGPNEPSLLNTDQTMVLLACHELQRVIHERDREKSVFRAKKMPVGVPDFP